MKRSLMLLAALSVAAGGLALGLRSRPERPPPVQAVAAPGRVNLVLVVVCTLRRDQLPPWGAPEGVAPLFAQLAREGTVFEDAYAAAPWTRAAATALLTGRHPIEVGMIEPSEGPSRRRLPASVQTLAERLGEAGYDTIGLTANPNLNRVFGFDQGYREYVEVTDRWRDGGAKVNGRRVVEEALAALDRAPPDAADRPFYLRLVLLDPHEPLTLPREEIARFQQKGLPPGVVEYRAAVHRVDQALGDLIAGLAARGHGADDTLLVVVNDHGEGLRYPEHHGQGHGYLTFTSTVGMPWLLWGAGAARGHRVRGVASQVDVVPTVLDLLGAAKAQDVSSGLSQAAAVQGLSDRTTREVAWVETWFQRADRAAAYRADLNCYRDRRIERGPPEAFASPAVACFDTRADPLQERALAVDSSLLAQLDAWREARWRDYEAAPKEDVELSEELGRQLEALGYLVEPGSDGG